MAEHSGPRSIDRRVTQHEIVSDGSVGHYLSPTRICTPTEISGGTYKKIQADNQHDTAQGEILIRCPCTFSPGTFLGRSFPVLHEVQGEKTGDKAGGVQANETTTDAITCAPAAQCFVFISVQM